MAAVTSATAPALASAPTSTSVRRWFTPQTVLPAVAHEAVEQRPARDEERDRDGEENPPDAEMTAHRDDDERQESDRAGREAGDVAGDRGRRLGDGRRVRRHGRAGLEHAPGVASSAFDAAARVERE